MVISNYLENAEDIASSRPAGGRMKLPAYRSGDRCASRDGQWLRSGALDNTAKRFAGSESNPAKPFAGTAPAVQRRDVSQGDRRETRSRSEPHMGCSRRRQATKHFRDEI